MKIFLNIQNTSTKPFLPIVLTSQRRCIQDKTRLREGIVLYTSATAGSLKTTATLAERASNNLAEKSQSGSQRNERQRSRYCSRLRTHRRQVDKSKGAGKSWEGFTVIPSSSEILLCPPIRQLEEWWTHSVQDALDKEHASMHYY